MAKWIEFRQCAGCNYDLITGEGERACSLHDCAYLPAELNVFCPYCLFDYATMEGNPPCDAPLTCEHGVEARANLANVEAWKRHHAVKA